MCSSLVDLLEIRLFFFLFLSLSSIDDDDKYVLFLFLVRVCEKIIRIYTK